MEVISLDDFLKYLFRMLLILMFRNVVLRFFVIVFVRRFLLVLGGLNKRIFF